MANKMNSRKIYIQAAEQISCQKPLCEEWMDEPLTYSEPLVHAQEPAFREFIAPNELRRMGKVIKRALVTALKVLRDTQTEHPEAIITGTSFGCLDSSEKFLDTLIENQEQTLSPIGFMQSTHNTISSALSINTKTHSYNTTYSHGPISFDLTLVDAWMQLQLGKIANDLVCANDEMLEPYFELLKKSELVGLEGMVPCGEISMSMMLTANEPADALCELAGVRIMHRPTIETLQQAVGRMLEQAHMSPSDLSAIMNGTNGKPAYDQHYEEIARQLFPNVPRLHYKHLFGETHTASAFGVYAAAHCLKRQTVPQSLYDKGSDVCPSLQSILVVNHSESGDCSLVLLKKF